MRKQICDVSNELLEQFSSAKFQRYATFSGVYTVQPSNIRKRNIIE